MDHEKRIGLGLAVALVIGLLWGALWGMNRQPAQPGPAVSVAAMAQPVTVRLLDAESIFTHSQTLSFASAYYSGATGYISTTCGTGYITYTWQSSPDNVTWFDQIYMPGISASQKITCALGSFGPYLRLSWLNGASTWMTATVWVSVKE